MVRFSELQCSAGPLICAARGHWRDGAPENSVDALEAAGPLGCELVSLDVRVSRSGDLMVFHDGTLDRMTAMRGPTDRQVSSSLTRLQLRRGTGGPDAPLSMAYLPLLREVMAVAKDQMALILNVAQPEHAQKVAGVIAAAGMADQVGLRFRVNDDEDGDRLCAIAADHGLTPVPSVSLLAQGVSGIVDRLCRLAPPLVSLCSNPSGTLPEWRWRLKDAGVAICAGLEHRLAVPRGWSDPDAVWAGLSEAGVAVIETTDPVAATQWRRRAAA